MCRRLLLVAAVALLSACTAKLEGTACLDGNGNNVCEGGEHSLTSVSLKISKDGQLLTHTRTNTLGQYVYNLQEGGYYCVEVDEPHLNQNLMFQLTYAQLPDAAIEPVQSNVSLGPPLGMSAKQVGSPSTGTTTTAGTTTTTTQPAQQEEESSEPSTPARPDLVEPGKVCKNITGMGETLHVPVLLDYEELVQQMPERISQEKRAGEIFTVPVPLLPGCVLETMYLPDGLIPLWPTTLEQINNFLNIDRDTGRIDFVARPGVTSVMLHLKVKEDLPLGDYEAAIEPAMLCPGGQRIALPQIPFTLKIAPFLRVEQNFALPPDGTPGENETFTWTISLINEGNQSLTVDVEGTAGGGGPVAGLSVISGSCRAVGTTRVECSRVNVEGGQTVALGVTVRTLADVDGERYITFDATAEVQDYNDRSFSASQADVLVIGDDD